MFFIDEKLCYSVLFIDEKTPNNSVFIGKKHRITLKLCFIDKKRKHWISDIVEVFEAPGQRSCSLPGVMACASVRDGNYAYRCLKHGLRESGDLVRG